MGPFAGWHCSLDGLRWDWMQTCILLYTVFCRFTLCIQYTVLQDDTQWVEVGANHCSEEGRPWHLRSLHPLPLQCPLPSLASPSPSPFNVLCFPKHHHQHLMSFAFIGITISIYSPFLSLTSPSSSSHNVTIIAANPFLFMCSQIKPSIASNSVDSPNLPNLGRKVNIWNASEVKVSHCKHFWYLW